MSADDRRRILFAVAASRTPLRRRAEGFDDVERFRNSQQQIRERMLPYAARILIPHQTTARAITMHVAVRAFSKADDCMVLLSFAYPGGARGGAGGGGRRGGGGGGRRGAAGGR